MEMRARANSSVGPERLPYKQEVAGSNPASPIGVVRGCRRRFLKRLGT